MSIAGVVGVLIPVRLVSAFDMNARITQRFRELGLDARRFNARYALEVQRRASEHFDAPFEYAARRAYAGLVLVEALSRFVLGHPHIHARRVAAAV